MLAAGYDNSLPLLRSGVQSTNDLDQVRQAVAQYYFPIQCGVSGRADKFLFSYNHFSLDGISFSTSHVYENFYFESEATENAYILQCAMLNGGCEISYGNSTVRIHKNGGGSMISPFDKCTWKYDTGQVQLVVRVKREYLEAYFRALIGRDLAAPLVFQHQMDTTLPRLGGLRNLLYYMAEDIERDGGVIHFPLVRERLKELLVNSLLYAQPHNYSDLLNSTVKPSGPNFIRQVEEYIEAYAGQPIRLQDLASIVGVSIRSLQAGFKRYRQKSVTEFIKDVRLTRAHDLLKNSPHLSVTNVAYQCGYNHLSQFAMDYKKKYKERPFETLLKCR